VSGEDRRFLYVFLDESGNLDFSEAGTRYLVFAAITLTRPFPWDGALASLKYDVVEQGTDVEYFHAAEDRQVVRNGVFGVISRHLSAFRLDTLVVDKKDVGPEFRAVEKLYPAMVGQLLRRALREAAEGGYSDIILTTDSIPVRRDRKAVEKAVKTALAQVLPSTCRYRVFHHASKSSASLQIVDYCTWAVFKRWERGDTRSYDVVRPALRTELPPGPVGPRSD
jgi:hypothetical protein